MSRRKRLSINLVLLATAGIGITEMTKGLMLIHAKSQQQPKATIAIVQPSAPSLEGRATGELKQFKFKGGDLKVDILAHPMPTTSLVFLSGARPTQKDPKTSNKNSVKVRLPHDAANLLRAYWQAYLGFCYRTELKHPPDAQSQVNEDRAIGALSLTTRAKLQELTIDAPDGRRNISQNEAVDILRFLNLSASYIVSQAKEFERDTSRFSRKSVGD